MSFIKSEAARAAYHASRAPAWAAAPMTAPGQGWSNGCYTCGDADATFFIKDRPFCRAHCPWLPRPRSDSNARPSQPAKRRKTSPRNADAQSPTSVDDSSVITPSGSARDCADVFAVAEPPQRARAPAGEAMECSPPEPYRVAPVSDDDSMDRSAAGCDAMDRDAPDRPTTPAPPAPGAAPPSPFQNHAPADSTRSPRHNLSMSLLAMQVVG